MTRASALVIAAAVALAAGAPAWAQVGSIIGRWTATFGGAGGRTAGVITDTFKPDGKVSVSIAGGTGEQRYLGVYRLLNGGTTVQTLFTRYRPKRVCAPSCADPRPALPLGQVMTSPVRFDGPGVLFLGAARYVRQR